LSEQFLALCREFDGDGCGWNHIIDLGELSTARGTEMLVPIWLRLMSTLGTPQFNFKIKPMSTR